MLTSLPHLLGRVGDELPENKRMMEMIVPRHKEKTRVPLRRLPKKAKRVPSLHTNRHCYTYFNIMITRTKTKSAICIENMPSDQNDPY